MKVRKNLKQKKELIGNVCITYFQNDLSTEH